MTENNIAAADEVKVCGNCKREIPVANFMMHEVHCYRHMVLCPQCDEAVPKSKLPEHYDELHKSVPCDLCKQQMQISLLEQHQKTMCPQRQVTCQFCELPTSFQELPVHESTCGTRTERCNQCQRHVMRRDAAQHAATQCAYPPVPSPPVRSADQEPNSSTNPFALLAAPSSKPHRHTASTDSNRRVPHHRRETPQRLPPPLSVASPPSQATQSPSTASGDRFVRDEIRRHLGVPPELTTSVNDWEDAAMLQEQLQAMQMDEPPQLRRAKTLLPCEVCGALVDGEMLYEHQSHCHRGSQPQPHIQRSSVPSSESRARDRTRPDRVAIPCEFCSLMLDMDSVVFHQVDCPLNPANVTGGAPPAAVTTRSRAAPVSPSSEKIPCDMCGRNIYAHTFLDHQARCAASRGRKSSSVAPSSSRRRDSQQEVPNERRASERRPQVSSVRSGSTSGRRAAASQHPAAQWRDFTEEENRARPPAAPASSSSRVAMPHRRQPAVREDGNSRPTANSKSRQIHEPSNRYKD